MMTTGQVKVEVVSNGDVTNAMLYVPGCSPARLCSVTTHAYDGHQDVRDAFHRLIDSLVRAALSEAMPGVQITGVEASVPTWPGAPMNG